MQEHASTWLPTEVMPSLEVIVQNNDGLGEIEGSTRVKMVEFLKQVKADQQQMREEYNRQLGEIHEENQRLQDRLKELHDGKEDDAASASKPAAKKERGQNAIMEITPANNQKSSITEQVQSTKEEWKKEIKREMEVQAKRTIRLAKEDAFTFVQKY